MTGDGLRPSPARPSAADLAGAVILLLAAFSAGLAAGWVLRGRR